jgi:hypothetical protein
LAWGGNRGRDELNKIAPGPPGASILDFTHRMGQKSEKENNFIKEKRSKITRNLCIFIFI